MSGRRERGHVGPTAISSTRPEVLISSNEGWLGWVGEVRYSVNESCIS